MRRNVARKTASLLKRVRSGRTKFMPCHYHCSGPERLESRELLAANPIAWWKMQEAVSGAVATFENAVTSTPDRDFVDILASPLYSNASPPAAPGGGGVPGNTAYSTSYNGGQGMFDQNPGFLDDATYTWEAFYRRANDGVAANFYGNNTAAQYNGISRVGVNADGDVVLQLTGNDIGTTGNTTEEFVFAGADDAQWHHFAFTYDNGTLKGYVDYQLVATQTPTAYTNGRVFTDFAYLTVGFANETSNPALSAFWSGDLDEIRISDDVLNPAGFLGADPTFNGSEAAWWRMQEATSGLPTYPPGLTDAVGALDLDNVLSSPTYSAASLPVIPGGVPIPGNTAYTTGYAGSQGSYHSAPGFLDDTTYTWEAFYRRANDGVAANFYGNDTAAHFNGISRVGVNADGDVVLQLTGNDVGTTGNTTEEFVFAGVDDDQWHHFAFTFNSGVLNGYVDYQLTGTHAPATYTNGRIFSDFAFLTVGFANETSNVALGANWNGDLDEIRISQDVLTPTQFLGFDPSFNVVVSLVETDYTLNISGRGTMQIVVGGNQYTVDSSFSFPGAVIGFHLLSENDAGTWSVLVTQTAPNMAQITATGGLYTLTRTIETSTERIGVEDTLANTSVQDVGVIVNHRINAENTPSQVLLSGIQQTSQTANTQNPTIFMADTGSRLGFVAEDTISRLKFQAFASGDQSSFQMDNFALAAGTSHTLETAYYPLDVSADYWEFINRVRDDWGVNNFAVEAFDFAPTKTKWDTPGALEPYLDRKHISIGEVSGFLDYDNFWIGTGLSIADQRDPYKLNAQQAIAAISAVDHTLPVLAAMEGPFYSLTAAESQQLLDLNPGQGPGFPIEMTATQYSLLQSWSLPFIDSVILSPNGRPWYEFYQRNGNNLCALLSYPENGNSQEAHWYEQATFLLDEVGVGGIYIDGGGPINAVLTTDQGWDGISVDINATTGQITNQFTDYRYVIGTGPLVNLFDMVLNGGKAMAANGFAYTQETQALPVLRFMETGGLYDPLAFPAGQMPPLLPSMFNGHLSATPTALANIPDLYGTPATDNYAEFVMKDVITHLRHGLLFSYYNTEIPQFGAGNGSYDAINAMFPLTPVGLHEGWVVGQERIVTAISGSYEWDTSITPRVQTFGLDGHETTPTSVTLTDHGGNWTVDLTMANWAGIAVIDKDPTATSAADFEQDGDVDGFDFLAWQRGFGLNTLGQLHDGDATGEGDVDGADLGIWDSQYGTVLPLSASSSTLLSTEASQPASAPLPIEEVSSNNSAVQLPGLQNLNLPDLMFLVSPYSSPLSPVTEVALPDAFAQNPQSTAQLNNAVSGLNATDQALQDEHLRPELLYAIKIESGNIELGSIESSSGSSEEILWDAVWSEWGGDRVLVSKAF